MAYNIFKFIHILGFILLGGGLIGVLITDLRSRGTGEIRTIAEACRYTAVFYDGVVVPGAVFAGLSGLALSINGGFGFLDLPWQTGMWTLFAFEFVEGNTITRIHFRRMLKLSREALAIGRVTGGLKDEQAKRLPTFTHFLDLPLFFLIVAFGALRPSSWQSVALGVVLALSAGTVLALTLPRRYKTA